MPRLLRNLNLLTISRSADNAIRKNMQHDTSKVLRLPRKMKSEMSKARVPRKMQHIFGKCSKNIAPTTQNSF